MKLWMEGGIGILLTDKPNMKRGLKEESLPYSMTTEIKSPDALHKPVTSNIFRTNALVILKVRHPHAKIYYTFGW